MISWANELYHFFNIEHYMFKADNHRTPFLLLLAPLALALAWTPYLIGSLISMLEVFLKFWSFSVVLQYFGNFFKLTTTNSILRLRNVNSLICHWRKLRLTKFYPFCQIPNTRIIFFKFHLNFNLFPLEHQTTIK